MELRTRPAVEPVEILIDDAEHAELQRLIAYNLELEFSGRLDPAEIEDLAAESIERFADASVRTFVPVLAARTARRLALDRLITRRTGSDVMW